MTNQIDMIIKGLNAYRRVYPAQKHNIEAIKKFIAPMSYKDKHQNILNSQRNVLYAIGGRAGLTNFQDYVKILKAEKKKNPNVLAMPFVRKSIYTPPYLAPVKAHLSKCSANFY